MIKLLSSELKGFYSSQKKLLFLFPLIGIVIGIIFLILNRFDIFTQNLIALNLRTKTWFYEINSSILDIIQYIFGLFLITYSFVRITEISKVNHAVLDKETRTPHRLCKEADYASVRHPMYGMFMINALCLGNMIGSYLFLGLGLLIMIFQGMNGILEEQKTLLPKFGDEYRTYQCEVTTRYLPNSLKVILIIYFWISVFDIIV